MIEYLVDTDWVVDYLKGRPHAVQGLSPLINRGALATTVITFAEVYDGLLGASERERRIQEFYDFLGAVRCLGIGMAEAQAFAELRFALRQRSELIPDLDLLIAGIALHSNLIPITNDAHFERIPELRLTRSPV